MIFGYFHIDPAVPAPSQSSQYIEFSFGKLFWDECKSYVFGPWTILYSGTICNLSELKDSYEVSSDQELFEKLLQKRGEEFFREFYGPFFLVAVNKSDQNIYFCNNNQQMHHLYYCERGKGLVVSSRLEYILPTMDQVEIFKPSLRSFIANGFTLSDEVQIKGVKKLLPSHEFVVSSSGVKTKNFWDQEYKSSRKGFDNLEQKLDEYEETYKKSVAGFLEGGSPRKLGALLSGGHDTSFALIQTMKLQPESLSAYTITFPEWNFNEEDYAKNIANKFGAKFNSVPFLPEHLDGILKLIKNVEEPVVGVALPLHTLGKKAAEDGVDTIIGGDGGDTLWGEYYPVAEVHKYLKGWPLWMRHLAHQSSGALAKITDWERFWELDHVLGLFDRKNFYKDFLTQLCTYRHFPIHEQKKLLTPELFEDGSVAHSSYQIPFNKNNFEEALIEGKLYNGFFTYMGFSQSKLFGQQGIEFFMPTVQRPVRDFITTLPQNWVNGGTTFHRLTNSKTINRRFHKMALSRYLKKEEIYNRSFDIPWYNILGPRKNTLALLKQRLINRGWYNKSYLDNLFLEFENQKVKDFELLELKHHGYRIFTLLSLEIWASLYLDGKYDRDPGNSLDEFLAN